MDKKRLANLKRRLAKAGRDLDRRLAAMRQVEAKRRFVAGRSAA
jgi:hypothetical protein